MFLCGRRAHMRPRDRGRAIFGKNPEHMQGCSGKRKICIWGHAGEIRAATPKGGPLNPLLLYHIGGGLSSPGPQKIFVKLHKKNGRLKSPKSNKPFISACFPRVANTHLFAPQIFFNTCHHFSKAVLSSSSQM